MELFREDGCLTDEGLQALVGGSLDEWGRLEAAEHLSYCDRCMDRYTALLTGAVLEQPPRDRCSAASSRPDRKSTRLNSSHVSISYAVFCLKKNNQTAYIIQS